MDVDMWKFWESFRKVSPNERSVIWNMLFKYGIGVDNSSASLSRVGIFNIQIWAVEHAVVVKGWESTDI